MHPVPEPVAASPLRIECHRLDLDAPLVEAGLAWLSATEQQRARRFRFEALRQRYIASRCAMRQLLGRKLGIAPAEVRFVLGPNDKPALDPDFGQALHFNLSHSAGIGWLAIGTQPLGIDLEYTARPMRDRYDLSLRVCSPDELAVLATLPAACHNPAFLLAWTRKEALLKAWGDGIGGLDALQHLDTALPSASCLQHFFDIGSPHAGSESAGARGLRSLPALHFAPPASLSQQSPPRPALWLQSLRWDSEIITLAAPAPFTALLHDLPGAPLVCPAPAADGTAPG